VRLLASGTPCDQHKYQASTSGRLASACASTVAIAICRSVRRLLHGDEHGHQGRADQQDSLTTAAAVGRGSYPARQVSAFGAVPLLRLARPHWKPIEVGLPRVPLNRQAGDEQRRLDRRPRRISTALPTNLHDHGRLVQ
jgi:hypothetical protein